MQMKHLTKRLTAALATLVLSVGAQGATLIMNQSILPFETGAPKLDLVTYTHNSPFTISIEHSNPRGPYLESPMPLTGGGALAYGKLNPNTGYLGLAAISQSKPGQFTQIIVGSDLSYTDEIHFEIPGATATTRTPVTMQFRVSGDVALSNSSYANAQVISSFGVGGIGIPLATINSLCTLDLGCTSSIRAPYYDLYIPDAVFEPGLTGEIGYDFFSIPIVLEGENPTLRWQTSVVAVAQGAVVDLSHTLNLGIIAPEGVTFSSPSGFLVSAVPSIGPDPEQPSTPVPEPQPYALFAVGLAMIGLSRQRVRMAGTRACAA